ncbi:MAG: GNAT family N-acetyltransferase [Actinomycetota bacterium]
MSTTTEQVRIDVRPFREDDEAGVLDLLKASLGPGPPGSRTPEFFRWKHLANPFGHSLMLVAEAGGQIVGLRAFMRWEFEAGGRAVRAVRAVDTATHPEFQRLGIFTRLTTAALEQLRGHCDLVFNTPNAKSGPGYLKMGWRSVRRIPLFVRIRRPARFLRGLGWARPGASPDPEAPDVDAPTAAEALADTGSLSRLLEELRQDGGRLVTPRNLDYLGWRYGAAPHLGYRVLQETSQGIIRGMAFFRVRPRDGLWETTVADLLVPPNDRLTASRLLRRVVTAAPVDHVACSFPPDSAALRAARRRGFLPVPGPLRLVVNPLEGELAPDPTRWSSWALSLGDLEVF